MVTVNDENDTTGVQVEQNISTITEQDNNSVTEQDDIRRMVETKLIEIVLGVINKDRTTELVEVLDDATLEREINSINFISLIVRIETEFDIEFDDEDLQFGTISSPEALMKYILNKMSDS